MACPITSGTLKGCKDNTGGVNRIWLANYEENTSYTYGTSSLITGSTMATQSFYQFYTPQNVATFNDPGQSSTENQTTFYTQTLIFSIYGRDADTIAKTELLMAGAFRGMIEAKNGKYFLIGESGPLQSTTSDGGVGKATGDMVGDIITLEAYEQHKAREIDAAYALTLIAL